MSNARYLLVTALFAVSLNACASGSGQAVMDSPARSSTRLVVQNNNFLDVAVYLMTGGSRMRLGTVRSNSTEQFRIPEAMAMGTSTLVVQADPIGSSIVYTSDPIPVYPGARVQLSVGSNVRLSTYSVFAGEQ
jgi:hypothetical protein